MLVVLIILFIACVAGYQAIDRIFDPRPVQVL
jgi:divalent metal cation (Fe/Co/Zn/Cd) transporter